jgi:hypothetical protein
MIVTLKVATQFSRERRQEGFEKRRCKREDWAEHRYIRKFSYLWFWARNVQ